MKKILFLLAALLITIGNTCLAKDPDVMSWATLMPKNATPKQVTALLGKPNKIADNKKTTEWHYTMGDHNLVVFWNKKSDECIKFSFRSNPCEKCIFDARLSRKLHSGTTDLKQTLALLGTPKDMTIKSSKQEVHYAYQNNVLRLFFRDQVLVDYTLLGQAGH